MATRVSTDTRLGEWPSGVDQVRDLRDLQGVTINGEPAAALRAAVNVDLNSEGRVRRRKGYTQLSAGHAHSLRGFGDFALMVRGGQLQRITLSGSTPVEQAIATVHPTKRMSYASIAGRVYFSNGQGRGVATIEGPVKPWGVEMPGIPVATAASFGGLDAGTYKVLTVFADASGEESGCGESAQVEIQHGQGITVEGLASPAPAGVSAARIYVTRASGDVLYGSKIVPAGVPSYTLTRDDVTQTGKALETQFCDRVPPSRLLLAYNGRIYFVPANGDGKRLYYTVPLWYGLYRRHENFIPFPDAISDAIAVADGLFVGTSKFTYRLSGSDPSGMTRVEIDPYGMVEGTATRIDGPNGAIDAVWWSNNGILFRAQDGGNATPLTRNRLALPSFERGAVMHREFNGLPQILSVLQGGSGNSFGARDTASAEVVRNGVVI